MVILSHGHVDHIGGVNFLRKMFGCKVYLGEPDAVMFKEHPELSLVQESGNSLEMLFESVEADPGRRYSEIWKCHYRM